MPDDTLISRSPSKGVWIIAYLLSPAIPFLCLRYARAIKTGECVFGILAALVTHIGLVTVLAATDGEPLQIFIVLLLGLSIYVIVFWQFLAGDRAGLWTHSAQKQWRIAGRFFGVFLLFGVVLAIASFHMRSFLDTKHSRTENTLAEQVASCNPLPAAVFATFYCSMNPFPVVVFRPSW